MPSRLRLEAKRERSRRRRGWVHVTLMTSAWRNLFLDRRAVASVWQGCKCEHVHMQVHVHAHGRASHICNWLPQPFTAAMLTARPLILWKSGISVADPPANQHSGPVHRSVNLCRGALKAGISPRSGFNRSRNPLMGNVTCSLI